MVKFTQAHLGFASCPQPLPMLLNAVNIVSDMRSSQTNPFQKTLKLRYWAGIGGEQS